MGKALWWAFVTITTVGYVDVSPITLQGRLIAVGLMIGGVVLIGVVTATLASWIVQEVTEEDTEHQASTKAQANRIEAKLNLILEHQQLPPANANSPGKSSNRNLKVNFAGEVEWNPAQGSLRAAEYKNREREPDIVHSGPPNRAGIEISCLVRLFTTGCQSYEP